MANLVSQESFDGFISNFQNVHQYRFQVDTVNFKRFEHVVHKIQHFHFSRGTGTFQKPLRGSEMKIFV